MNRRELMLYTGATALAAMLPAAAVAIPEPIRFGWKAANGKWVSAIRDAMGWTLEIDGVPRAHRFCDKPMGLLDFLDTIPDSWKAHYLGIDPPRPTQHGHWI